MTTKKFNEKYFRNLVHKLREIKMAGDSVFDNESDDEIVESLCILFKVHTPDFGVERGDLNNFDFEDKVKKKLTSEFIDKYKNKPFNIKKIKKTLIKEVSEMFGLKSADRIYLPVGFYWMRDSESMDILDSTIEDKYFNVDVRAHIIDEVVGYILKNRNIENANKACALKKDELIGKFVVTEDIVMSGFIKNTMTLKMVGYQVGEIVDKKYGERHGYDNIWDDKVPDRYYLVIKLENNTDSKELEKNSWQKVGMLYAIDITPTLQVFDTKKQALDVAKQLNEEVEDLLTLDY